MTDKLIYFAGPCVIDKPEVTYDIAHALSELLRPFKDRLQFAFKASYDKANRTRHMSYRGVGLKQGLEVLSSIKKDFGFKILTDVHQPSDVESVSQIADVIQVPSLLSRQTDLIVECAKTNKTINVKKGQFMSPDDVKYVVEKIEDNGNTKIILTERGTCFGYKDLIVDLRSVKIMQKLGYPVVVDVSHSVGWEYALEMSWAAMAFGADGLFTEVYPNPLKAKCDGDKSIYLSKVEQLIEKALAMRKVFLDDRTVEDNT